MATATKAKGTKAQEESVEEEKNLIDEQIEVFEPVALSVERTLTHPETGETKTFSQHEMGFLTKLKFFRLLSGTIRLASEQQGGAAGAIQQIMDAVSGNGQTGDTEAFLDSLLQLIELAPDFIEEAYILALNVRPNDVAWVSEAFESLDDDEGMDILETFVAQNGESLRDFFVKRLRRVGQRINQTVSLDTEEGSEDTQ